MINLQFSNEISISFIMTVGNVVVVFSRSLPKNMNMMEDHEVSQAGRRLRARNTGRKERVAKERLKQSVLSWTEQNEIRGVLDRMTADAA